MKELQALLVALVGAAAAIPGIAITRQFHLPSGTGPLFEFALSTFSAAVVLTAYAARKKIGSLGPGSTFVVGALGMVIVFGAFIGHQWITSRVLVEHRFSEKAEEEMTFFPLFLTSQEDSTVAAAGGRRRFIETPPGSPTAVADMRTERNVALTLAVMLATYTLLIAAVATLFALLGFNALANSEPGQAKPADA